jgi:hypothetical protein
MITMPRLKLAGLLLLAALLVVLAGAPAEAHRGLVPTPLPAPIAETPPVVELPVHVLVAAPATPALPWPFVVAVLLASAVALRWPRRALALGLILLAAVFAFENGVHSVHHLADPGRGSDCALASASQNVSGTEVSPIVIERAPVPLGAAMALRGPASLPDRPFRLHEGRAPPQAV